MRALRLWHRRALHSPRFRQLLRGERRDFLCVATPGAGKTAFACHSAKRLRCAQVDRVLAIVPTSHLRRQWADAAREEVGLNLSATFANADERLSPDFDGAVATYQQVAANPQVWRELATERPTLVILDELHHGGDEKDWGSALRFAFGKAACRLGLSGTPFRSDDCPIPFVSYVDGRGVADFTYGYSQAIRDGICRKVYFVSTAGEATWRHNGMDREASFRDYLPKSLEGQRLRAALLAEGGFTSTLLAGAHAKLQELRETDAHAAGLVVAIDQDHAQQLADLLADLTGERPVVVISRDDEAPAELAAFRHGTAPWVVAVKMVSEGVDIPRLRVLAYCANVCSELFFRQVVGRISRGRAQDFGWAFIPDDPRLTAFARDIEQERDHVLDVGEDEEARVRQEGLPGEPSEFEALSSSGRLAHVIDGLTRTPVQGNLISHPCTKTLEEQLAFHRAQCQTLVNTLARLEGKGENWHARISATLNEYQQAGNIRQCSLLQLQQRQGYLQQRIEKWTASAGKVSR